MQMSCTPSVLDKTPVKFQKDQDKIVGGVALTRYLMSISFSSS